VYRPCSQHRKPDPDQLRLKEAFFGSTAKLVQIKLRSFSGANEIEDLFDAVFEWMKDPVARQAAESRQRQIDTENDE
jgi:hypothetical protein